MRWKMKMHEFDHDVKIYRKQGLMHKEIYIFGAGFLGRKYSAIIKKFCNFCGFIDNDIRLHEKSVLGEGVISLQTYNDTIKDKDSIIVICMREKYYQQVRKQLGKISMTENIDFMVLEEFEKRLRILLYYDKSYIYIPTVQISLTERCTLRCRKCAHACNYVSPREMDMELEQAKESTDYFFKYADYVAEFVLIGGEPFLYNKLSEFIEYVGSYYRKKIGVLSITTNGTIIPNDDVFAMCKKYEVLIRISNYVDSIPRMKERLDMFKIKADNYGVCYRIGETNTWTDYGFDYVDRGGKPEQLEKVFDECMTPCHEIRKNRFYFCIMARSVAENMGKNVGENDFFDFMTLDGMVKKKEFFEYTMGYSEKGYLDMCNYCHGAEREKYPIPIAEQMEVVDFARL